MIIIHCLTENVFKYRTAGVREYWVVEPERELVMVYNFEKDNRKEYSFDKDIPMGIYNGILLNIEWKLNINIIEKKSIWK